MDRPSRGGFGLGLFISQELVAAHGAASRSCRAWGRAQHSRSGCPCWRMRPAARLMPRGTSPRNKRTSHPYACCAAIFHDAMYFLIRRGTPRSANDEAGMVRPCRMPCPVSLRVIVTPALNPSRAAAQALGKPLTGLAPAHFRHYAKGHGIRHGLNPNHRAKRRLERTHLQHLMTAGAMNVVRLLQWLAGYRKPRYSVRHSLICTRQQPKGMGPIRRQYQSGVEPHHMTRSPKQYKTSLVSF